MGSHNIVNKTRVMRLIVKVVRVVIKATALVPSHEFFYSVSKDDSTSSLVNVAKESRETLKRHDHEQKP